MLDDITLLEGDPSAEFDENRGNIGTVQDINAKDPDDTVQEQPFKNTYSKSRVVNQ